MYLRYIFKSAKEWLTQSDQRWKAWLLLIGAVVTSLGFALILVQVATVASSFFAALAAMNSALFFASAIKFAGVILLAAGCNYLNTWFQNRLKVKWRKWIFNSLSKKLLSTEEGHETNLADIYRFQNQIPNPGYTLQDTVKDFVSSSIDMTIGLSSSLLNFATSVGLLWVVGGALKVVLLGTVITIPGFLVWAAVAFSAISAIGTHIIGKRLAKQSKEQQNSEAVLRHDLEVLQEQAESITLEGGQKYYQRHLNRDIDSVSEATIRQQSTETKVGAFTFLYQNIAGIFPFIAAAPLYFSGALLH